MTILGGLTILGVDNTGGSPVERKPLDSRANVPLVITFTLIIYLFILSNIEFIENIKIKM